jgi:hypothetical protein
MIGGTIWTASRHGMTTTTMKTMKMVYDHSKEDPPEWGKYARRAKARRRDQRLPRRYIAQLPRLMKAMRCSFSWRR